MGGARRAAGARGQRAVGQILGGGDCLEQCVADAPLGEASGDGADTGQGVGVGGGGGGDFQQRLVLDQALAGDVDALRLASRAMPPGPAGGRGSAGCCCADAAAPRRFPDRRGRARGR